MYKTESQKIVNLWNDTDNGMSLMIKIIQNMVKEMKMIQTLHLIQKLSNQVLVITQMHIFL